MSSESQIYRTNCLFRLKVASGLFPFCRTSHMLYGAVVMKTKDLTRWNHRSDVAGEELAVLLPDRTLIQLDPLRIQFPPCSKWSGCLQRREAAAEKPRRKPQLTSRLICCKRRRAETLDDAADWGWDTLLSPEDADVFMISRKSNSLSGLPLQSTGGTSSSW